MEVRKYEKRELFKSSFKEMMETAQEVELVVKPKEKKPSSSRQQEDH